LYFEEHASHFKLYTTKLHEPFGMRLVMQILPKVKKKKKKNAQFQT